MICREFDFNKTSPFSLFEKMECKNEFGGNDGLSFYFKLYISGGIIRTQQLN